MAFTDGRRSRFRIADSGGVMRDLSAYITEVSGLPGERTLNEVTALGDLGARFKPGAESTVFTLSGLFDDTAVHGRGLRSGRTEIPHRPHTVRVRAVRFHGGQGALHRKVLGEVLRTTQSRRRAGVLEGDAASRRHDQQDVRDVDDAEV